MKYAHVGKRNINKYSINKVKDLENHDNLIGIITASDIDKRGPPITKLEIKYALRNVKDGTVTGGDNIPIALLKR